MTSHSSWFICFFKLFYNLFNLLHFCSISYFFFVKKLALLFIKLNCPTLAEKVQKVLAPFMNTLCHG